MPNLNYTVLPPVVPVNQGAANLCWLAATAVLFGWRDHSAISMQQAANQLGVEFIAKYGAGDAL